MSFKIPKPPYPIVLGTLMFTFAVTACNNKGSKDKGAAKDTTAKMVDSVTQKPTQTGDQPVTPDSVKQKPTQTGD